MEVLALVEGLSPEDALMVLQNIEARKEKC
jgi:hypothetical protein